MYLSSPDSFLDVKLSDGRAFCSHAEDHAQVNQGYDAKYQVPEPKKSEDLFRDDVGSQNAEVVLGVDPSSTTVAKKIALSHPWENLIKHCRAVHLGVYQSTKPVVALK